jgi:hypothetical protein
MYATPSSSRYATPSSSRYATPYVLLSQPFSDPKYVVAADFYHPSFFSTESSAYHFGKVANDNVLLQI